MAELHLSRGAFMFCRLCFSKTLVFTSLLSPETSTMLGYLDIKLFPSENNEEMVYCTLCDLELKRAYKTRQKFITTQTHLEKYGSAVQMKGDAEVKNHVLGVLEGDVDFNVTTCVICNTVIKCEDLTSHFKLHIPNPNSADDKDRVSSSLVLTTKSSNKKRILENVSLNDSNKKHCLKEFQPQIKCKKAPEVGDLKPPYICSICSREFHSKGRLQAHIRDMKLCTICDKEIRVSNFSKHTANHSSVMQICETCGRTYDSDKSLRKHIYDFHRNVIYKCEECNITFRYNTALHWHKARVHKKIKNIVCELCGKKFFIKHHLNQHHKISHLKERNYICKFCNKAFSGGYALKTHVRQHTNETPFNCEICREGFRQKVSLKGHKKSKHNIVEPITCTCSYCGKGFGSEWALGVHTLRLHPEAVD